MNCLYITLFFNIVAGIGQTLSHGNSSASPSHRSLPPAIWFLGNAYGTIAVTVAWIQERDVKPMFHLQSQWSPETHLFPVRSA